MEMILLSGIVANLIITVFLVLQVNKVKRSVHGIKVMYFADVSDVTGFIKKQKKIQVKAQLLIGDVPVGQPFVMSEQITEVVDEKRVLEIIKNIAMPLAEIGITVVTKGIA